jgi:hypothetical protein
LETDEACGDDEYAEAEDDSKSNLLPSGQFEAGYAGDDEGDHPGINRCVEGGGDDEKGLKGEAPHGLAEESAGDGVALEDGHEEKWNPVQEDGDDCGPCQTALKEACGEYAKVEGEDGELGDAKA